MLPQVYHTDLLLVGKSLSVLPLKDETIYVTGLPSQIYYHGGGSSAVIPNRPFVPLDETLQDLGYDAYYSESIGKIYGANVSMGNLRQACLNSEQSDVTILTVGTGDGAEVEETDRRDVTLTPEELDAVRYLRKYAKKLVVVVYAGSAVDLKEFDNLADAVVLAGFGGQNVSQAVANVLTGKVNPSGRLTETYAYSLSDIPSEHTYRDEAVMVYEEGLNVGYRHFETQKVPVLYPFGHGLSYFDFKYSDLKVVEKEEQIEVNLQVKNTSDRDGKEVVQLYVSEVKPTVYRPIRELKAFEKVFVKAHESVEVKILLGKDALSYYSAEKGKWEVNSGIYVFQIGKNAHEIILEEEVGIDMTKKIV